jgi:polyhydroxyalkanoate synthesis regulator protein
MILKDIESRGLVQFNKEYLDEEFFKNFIKFRKSFSHSMAELVSKLDTFETKNEELTNFIIYSELSYINSHLDVIKKFLKIIINPIKLDEGFGKDTTLEQMIERICKKMNYGNKLQNSIRGLFLLDFREATAQQQFVIEKTGDLIINHKNENKMQLNIKDLADYSSQAMEILAAMFDWSNDKIQKPEKNPDGLDDLVSDLTKQVQELDKKLDNLS